MVVNNATAVAAAAAVAAVFVVQGVVPAVLPDQLPLLLDASAPFRDAYLSAGFVRLQVRLLS